MAEITTPLPASPGQDESQSVANVMLSPLFKLTFLGLVSLTALSLIVPSCLLILFREQLPPGVQALVDTCLESWRRGFWVVLTLAAGGLAFAKGGVIKCLKKALKAIDDDDTPA